jgi:hypothetical protein
MLVCLKLRKQSNLTFTEWDFLYFPYGWINVLIRKHKHNEQIDYRSAKHNSHFNVDSFFLSDPLRQGSTMERASYYVFLLSVGHGAYRALFNWIPLLHGHLIDHDSQFLVGIPVLSTLPMLITTSVPMRADTVPILRW